MTILTADKIAAFSASERVVVVGFFESETSKEYLAFAEAANVLRENYLFGVSTDPKSFTEFGVEAPAVLLFKKFDDNKSVFEDVFTKAALTAFVKDNGTPTMDDIGPQNYQQFVDSGLPLAYLFVTPENRDVAGPHVETVAKEFKGKVSLFFLSFPFLFSFPFLSLFLSSFFLSP